MSWTGRGQPLRLKMRVGKQARPHLAQQEDCNENVLAGRTWQNKRLEARHVRALCLSLLDVPAPDSGMVAD